MTAHLSLNDFGMDDAFLAADTLTFFDDWASCCGYRPYEYKNFYQFI